MHQPTPPTRLRDYIAEESGALIGTLRLYLLRAGLAQPGQALDAAAHDLLNDVVVEALRHEDRFRAAGQPRAWLLGVAANLIRRRQAELFRRERREPLARDLAPGIESEMSDADVFDWLEAQADRPRQDFEAAEPDLLRYVGGDDRQVLRLAILHELDGPALARELGVAPGAARVRLHRALNRLRAAYQRLKEDDHD